MPYHFWEEEAIAFLEQHSENMPFNLLVAKFQNKARRSQWHYRTREAIGVKLKKLGLSRQAQLDNFPAHTLAKALNISIERIDRWIDTGKLKYKPLNQRRIVSLESVREFARRYPLELMAIDVQYLAWVLGEEKAQEIAKARSVLGLPLEGSCGNFTSDPRRARRAS